MQVIENRAAVARSLRRGLASFASSEPMTLREWAEKHFYLSAESSYVEQRWEAWPFQRGILACVGSDDVHEVDFIKSARVGYALALDTPIPTPFGWTVMGDLRPGGMVLSDEGKPCTVRHVSPIYTDHQCYEIEFCDGTTVVADEGHRWLIESDQSFEYLLGEAGPGRRPVGAPVTKSGVVNTGDIYRMQRTARGRTSLAVRNAKPLALDACVDLPIPPYTLGLWLGDGNTGTPRITQHYLDVETAQYIEEEGIKCSVRFIDERYPGNAVLFLDAPETGRPVSPWARVFRSLGLLDRKFIPGAYLRASYDQRLALLRGLMDSDGTIGTNGRCEFTNTNENLARGVYELAVSLGMKAFFHERKSKQQDHHLQQYRVGFRPELGVNPFRIKRKAARVVALAKPGINERRRIVRVTSVDPVPVRCIQVDSPSNLFLCSRAMIPTHNTKILLAAVGYFAEHRRRNQALWQPTDDDRDEFVKNEVDPMIRDVPVLHPIFPAREARHKHNTMKLKKFIGSSLYLKGGKSAKNYRRISPSVCYLDEYSSFDPDVDGEGDPGTLASKRLEGATFPKLVIGSTPKIKGTCLMEKRVAGATARYTYQIRCPHCDERHALTWGGKDEPHGFKWVDGNPETARHLCPHCGALSTQGDYLAAADDGIWVGDDGTTIDHDGVFRDAEGNVIQAHLRVAFHVWTAYSPMVAWSKIVREFLDAHAKALQGEDEELRTFWNTTLGRAWEGEIDKLEGDELKRRAEIEQFNAPGLADVLVPRRCMLLLAGCDVQGNRIEVGVWGVGRGGETWTIDHIVLFGNPSEDQVWGNLAETLFERRYQHEDGASMPIYASAIDTGGHHAHAVYEFARRHKARRVYAVRGRPTGEKAIKDGVTTVDIDWRGKKVRKGVRLWYVGTNMAKDLLYGRLQVETPGRGYVHLAANMPDEWFRQFSAEARAVRRTATGSRSLWVKLRSRNEALDCCVYAIWLEEHLELARKTDSWWQRLADKLGIAAEEEPPPSQEEETTTTPAKAGVSTSTPAPVPKKAPAQAPAVRRPAVRRASSSYLRGRR